MQQNQMVIALVKIIEPQEDGSEKTYQNGTIFTPSKPELADYYVASGYARKPTGDELAALARLPEPKPRPAAQPRNRQQQPVAQGSDTQVKPKVGRGNRRDVSSAS